MLFISKDGHHLSKQAYTVHFKRQIDRELYEAINSAHLLSEGTSVVILNTTALQVVFKSSYVDVLRDRYEDDIAFIDFIAPENKYNVELMNKLKMYSLTSGNRSVLLSIAVMAEIDAINTVIRVCTPPDCNVKDMSLSNTTFDEQYKIIVLSVAETSAASILHDMTRLHEVLWIEEHSEYEMFNKWATPICKNADISRDYEIPIGISNLTGHGMIIGLADTGINGNNCFFKDENIPFVYNTENKNHRKILYYGARYGDTTERVGGHGTHVAGTLAGNTQGSAADYNGIAPNANIAFMDIENSATGAIRLPYDIKELFRPMYVAGARVFSKSWGNPGLGGYANSYTLDARGVDQFMQLYPDALVIFAAGNGGQYGHHSVSTPSTNKNGISVGASLNDWASFVSKYGESVPSTICKDGLASFSAIGPTADSRLKPDLLAPGFVCDPQ